MNNSEQRTVDSFFLCGVGVGGFPGLKIETGGTRLLRGPVPQGMR